MKIKLTKDIASCFGPAKKLELGQCFTEEISISYLIVEAAYA
jgi:hypothetical protein